MAHTLSPGNPPIAPVAGQQEAWHENLNITLACPECREFPPNLYEDHASGDLLCSSCGLVLQQRTVDTSSEWRTFSNDESGHDDPSRVGEIFNPLLNGEQLSTGIAAGNGFRSRELQRLQNDIPDKGNKALMQAYKQIGALSDGWQLPTSVSDTAKHIYKDAENSRLFKGKSQDALIAGCVFLACRRNQVPRSFREVMTLTNVSKKEIGRTFKALESYLVKKDKMNSENAGTNDDEYKPTGTADASELCTRYCSQLGMNQRATNVAVLIASKTQSIGTLAGRSPLSVAAACIFAAGHLMGQAKNAKDIVQVAGVSDSTIRQAYRKLYENLDNLITEEMLSKGAEPSKLPKPA